MTTTNLLRLLDPFREMDRMNRAFSGSASRTSPDFPAVNVWVNGDDAVVTTEVPGVNKESIDISVTGNTVTLKGERPSDERREGESLHRHELWHGNFSKSIKLPFNIDSDKVNAIYKNGVLKILLPHLEAEKPKKINIKSE